MKKSHRAVMNVVLAVILLPSSFFPQHTHSASTLTACVKNSNEWSFGLNGIPFGDQARLVMKPLGDDEIRERAQRLLACQISSLAQLEAAPIEQRQSLDVLGVLDGRARNLSDMYILEHTTRMINFMGRHKLFAQFDQEDKAGER